jgi:hypothetical protein
MGLVSRLYSLIRPEFQERRWALQQKLFSRILVSFLKYGLPHRLQLTLTPFGLSASFPGEAESLTDKAEGFDLVLVRLCFDRHREVWRGVMLGPHRHPPAAP